MGTFYIVCYAFAKFYIKMVDAKVGEGRSVIEGHFPYSLFERGRRYAIEEDYRSHVLEKRTEGRKSELK